MNSLHKNPNPFSPHRHRTPTHQNNRSSHRTPIAYAGNNNDFGNLFDAFKESFLNSFSPSQQDQGGTFVELDPNSTSSLDNSGEEGTFGPLALLVVGFLEEEFQHIQELLLDIGADAVQLIPCTQTMLQGTLGEAFTTTNNTIIDNTQNNTRYEPPAIGTRRVVFLSGMYASEVIEIVGLLRESPYLPSTMAFAAAIPKSWGKNLNELIQDVYADHAEMMKKRKEMELEAARLLVEEEERD